MKRILATLVALSVLTGCEAKPETTSIPNTVVLQVPGTTLVRHSFMWTIQGATSLELAELESEFSTPEDIAKFLVNNYPWLDDYDITEFLSPNQLVAQKRGVCTAFARFWQYELQKKHIKADFVAIYSPKSAHAVTVFEDPNTHQYRICSNQFYYKKEFGSAGGDTPEEATANRKAALHRIAAEFYTDWSLIEIYSDSGQIIETIINPKFTGTPIPMSPQIKFDLRV